MESTPLKLADGNVKTDTYYSFGEPTRTNRNKFMTKVGAWIKKVLNFFTTPPN